MNGLFVTGTDTGVGKTVVTAGIVCALRARGHSVGVAKSVQSGALTLDPEGDAMMLKRWTKVAESPGEIAPFSFAAPLAPSVEAIVRLLSAASVTVVVDDLQWADPTSVELLAALAESSPQASRSVLAAR